jgi:hypothetical protein
VEAVSGGAGMSSERLEENSNEQAEPSTTISKATASQYRREILQGFYEKHAGHGQSKRQITLTDTMYDNRRKQLRAYEDQHPTRKSTAQAVRQLMMDSAATIQFSTDDSKQDFLQTSKCANTAINALTKMLKHLHKAEEHSAHISDQSSFALSHALAFVSDDSDLEAAGKDPISAEPSSSADVKPARGSRVAVDRAPEPAGPVEPAEETCVVLLASGKRPGQQCGRKLPCKFHRKHSSDVSP